MSLIINFSLCYTNLSNSTSHIAVEKITFYVARPSYTVLMPLTKSS